MICFTDPGYGGLMNYEGERLQATSSAQPLQKEAVYRIDAPGKIDKVADEPFKPKRPVLLARLRRGLHRRHRQCRTIREAKSVIWVYDVDGKKLKNRQDLRRA